MGTMLGHSWQILYRVTKTSSFVHKGRNYGWGQGSIFLLLSPSESIICTLSSVAENICYDDNSRYMSLDKVCWVGILSYFALNDFNYSIHLTQNNVQTLAWKMSELHDKPTVLVCSCKAAPWYSSLICVYFKEIVISYLLAYVMIFFFKFHPWRIQIHIKIPLIFICFTTSCKQIICWCTILKHPWTTGGLGIAHKWRKERQHILFKFEFWNKLLYIKFDFFAAWKLPSS